MSNYLNKYWLKAPHLEHKKFFMTKQGLKDYTFKLGQEEFPYAFHTTHQHLIFRLERKGYKFSLSLTSRGSHHATLYYISLTLDHLCVWFQAIARPKAR